MHLKSTNICKYMHLYIYIYLHLYVIIYSRLHFIPELYVFVCLQVHSSTTIMREDQNVLRQRKVNTDMKKKCICTSLDYVHYSISV